MTRRQSAVHEVRTLHRPSSDRQTRESGPAATALETRVQELEKELRRVEQERDILKKALAIFSQRM